MTVMVDEVVVPTGIEVTVKVAVVEFAGTVTLGGTVAALVLLLDSVTTAPAAGAGPVRTTVAVEGVPPMTDMGLMVNIEIAGGVTVNVVVTVLPRIADIVTGVLVATGLVVAVKVAEVAFAAMVTVAGTCTAAVLPLVRLMTTPPAGAGPLIRTVPVDALLPRTETGLTETLLMAGVFTVKLAVFVTP